MSHVIDKETPGSKLSLACIVDCNVVRPYIPSL